MAVSCDPGAMYALLARCFEAARRKGVRFPALKLGVGEHAGDFGRIRDRDQDAFAQLALGFLHLGGEDVAHLGLAALELAGAGLFEALGRAAVGFEFGHVGSVSMFRDNLLIVQQE